MKYILSYSGGADSTALFLFITTFSKNKRLVYPLDEVIFVDTGWEYKCCYDAVNIVSKRCEELDIKFTKIDINLEKYFKKYGWCGKHARYGTSYKVSALQKYYNKNYKNDFVTEYIGYTKEENNRIKRYSKAKTSHIYPLIEQGITKNDALIMCYKNGIKWEENGKNMYDYLDRLSCTYCANKNLKELKALYLNFPNYWNDIKEQSKKTKIKYKDDLNFDELENKFKNQKIIASKSKNLAYSFLKAKEDKIYE